MPSIRNQALNEALRIPPGSSNSGGPGWVTRPRPDPSWDPKALAAHIRDVALTLISARSSPSSPPPWLTDYLIALEPVRRSRGQAG